MTQNDIGRYIIHAEIARGGMATVYRAFDPRFEREVAVKILPRAFLHDPQFRVRFEREAKMIALLEHPSIVPVYDFGEEDDQPYIVMRYMSGGSLKDRLEDGPFSIQETAEMIERLAPALDAAHARNITHRDLKPGNILFDQYQNAYISDFGIARIAEGAGATLTGTAILGTPAYMSPEQVEGNKDLDGKSDIYSLGVLTYQMLTGETPYQADTPARLMMMHVLHPVPNISERMPDLPEDCRTVIAKAMAKAPQDRFQTASQLSLALKRVASGQPSGVRLSDPKATIQLQATEQPSDLSEVTSISAGKRQAAEALSQPGLPAPPVGQEPGQRRLGMPRAVLVAITIVILLCFTGSAIGGLAYLNGGGDAWLGGLPFGGTSPTDTLPAATSTGSNEEPVIVGLNPSETPLPLNATATPVAATNTPAPTATPTSPPTPDRPIIGGADQIAFIDQSDIWIANLDGSDLQRLTEDGTAKTDLQWSTDGKSVQYISGKCIYQVQIEDRQVETIACFNFALYLKSFEISPDGERVAISLDNQFYLIPFDRQRLSQVKARRDLTEMASCPEMAPLEKYVVLFNRWSAEVPQVAMITWGVARDLGAVDTVRVISSEDCSADPEVIVNFPSPWFIPSEYAISSEMETFGWDGINLFTFTTNMRNNGYGNLYIFNSDTLRAVESLNPIEESCCYRDPQWSPDGSHLLFLFQKHPGGDGSAQFYYIPYGTIGTGVQYAPLPLPTIQDPREKPLPALRVAQ